jgi:hypothetical protein
MSSITIRVTYESCEGQVITHQQKITSESLAMASSPLGLCEHAACRVVDAVFESVRQEGFEL